MSAEDTHETLKNFIVFEGIDGSGTTTQLRKVSSLFENRGIGYIATAEPTSRPEGLLIRRILRGEIPAHPGTVAFLFAADRHEHLYGQEGIISSLQNGEIALCDRYLLSSLAYQGVTCESDLPIFLNSRFPRPGLTLYFRIDPEMAMKRVLQREHLEIYEKLYMQKKVGDAYERIVEKKVSEGWNIKTIQAENPIDMVSKQVLEIVSAYLKFSR
jgi:dTMP kinase